MLLSPPSESEQAAIRAAHVQRFPQALRVPLTGDGGASVIVHLLVANPSGCAKSSPSAPPPTGDPWRTFLATVLRRDPEPSTFRADLCADVVLWPNPATEWPQLLARWPGITQPISTAMLRKVGALDEMTRPSSGLSFSYRPTATEERMFSVAPPDAMRWQIFMDAMRDERADLWRTLWEMVIACVHMDDLDATITRWPGFAIQAFTVINRLAGASAEAELGE